VRSRRTFSPFAGSARRPIAAILATFALSSAVTVGLSISVLGEAFTPWHAVGTALVLVGVWLFGRKAKPKRAEVEAAEVQP